MVNRKIFLITGLALILCLVFAGCGKKPVEAPAEVKKIPVTVEAVEKGNLEKTVSLGGLLKPQDEVYLSAKNPAARVMEVSVKVGDRVAIGTPLVIFDAREINIQLNQAQTDYDRNSQLHEMGALSSSQLEQSKNQLANLKLQKEALVLSSPVNGIVSSVTAVEGQLAGAGALVSVVNIDKVKLEVQVGEANIGKIQKGEEMPVNVPSIGAGFTGQIITVPPQVDSRTKAYHITLEIDNEENLIKGGMYGEVKLVTERKEGVISIPQNAILDQDRKKVVYIVENDIAVMKVVEVGLTLGDKAEIKSGLNGSEMLIVEGQYSVKEGTPVSANMRGEGQ